jgi:hypothetical protein
MFQQLFDYSAFADNEAPVAPFDQPRASDQQAVVSASEPQIIGRSLAKTPKSVDHLPSL